MKDFQSYLEVQRKVSELYQKPLQWAEKCLRNIAASGKFSSDRTIREYARDIWGVDPSGIKLPPPSDSSTWVGRCEFQDKDMNEEMKEGMKE